jgi:hypothetical protein
MTEAQRHSSAIDALIEVSQRLTSAQFPPNEKTARVPKSGTENDRTGVNDEWIDVAVGIPEGESSTEWGRVGAGAPGRRDETYTIHIHISSTVQGYDRIGALERLRVLTQVVEDLFYDPTTGAFTPVGAGEPWGVARGGMSAVMPEAWRTDEGWFTTCVVSVDVYARI